MRKYFRLIDRELINPGLVFIKQIKGLHPLDAFFHIFNIFKSSSLFRNSIYIMLGTFVSAFFGLFFWMINARLYSPENVGKATALISVMTLISGISSLGLDVGLVRFIHLSNYRNKLINTTFIINSLASLLFSLIFLNGIKFFSPNLIFITENYFYLLFFIIFVAVMATNTLVDSIFVAYRSAKFVLLKNIILGLAKLLFSFLVIQLSAYGIFASVGFGFVLSLIFSLYIFVKFFGLRLTKGFDYRELKKVFKYSFGNYISGLLISLPSLLMPVIIANRIGPAQAGYFYIALMIANNLFMISGATTQSLFAEGSFNHEKIGTYIGKTVASTFLLLIPAIIIIVFFGNYILLVFGKTYSSEASELLRIFSVSSIFIAVNNICITILKINNKVKELIGITLFGTISILSLSFIFMGFNLFGMGLAWISGLGITTCVYLLYLGRMS